MLSEISFIIYSVLHFFLVEEAYLGRSESFNPSDIVGVVVFILVVEVVDLVVIDMLLLCH